MKAADFDYDLPLELIAQEPAARRDGARMLVLNRAARTLEHRLFADLPAYLRAGDLLVANDTRVIPARVFGRKTKAGTGGKVEFLLLEETAPGVWDALMRSRRRPQVGDRIALDEDLAVATVLENGELGRVRIRIESELPWLEVLERIGQTPLPPYIQRKDATPERRAVDKVRYQTVFAREPGAVAAPTAGLHFTPEVLGRLAAQGVDRATVTLHVGIGTFRPVAVDDVEAHKMDFERWWITEETAAKIQAAKAAGGRTVAVGTTSVRTLESAAARPTGFGAGQGRTDLFIYPPYEFKVVDAMVTNFHLPKSTLIMMISAFAGREFVLEAYREAIRERYRFYSYGDCMLILCAVSGRFRRGSEIGEQRRGGQAGLGQRGVPVVHAPKSEGDERQRPPALGAQAEFAGEDVGVEAFHRAGVEAERRRAEQQPAEREIHLLFHPGRRVAADGAVEFDVGAARLPLLVLVFRRGKTAVPVFLVEDRGEMGVVGVRADAQRDDVGRVADLRRVVGVGADGRPRTALPGFRGGGHDEMLRLGIDRRRTAAQQRAHLFEDGVRNAAAGVEGLGGAAGRGDLGDVHGRLRVHLK